MSTVSTKRVEYFSTSPHSLLRRLQGKRAFDVIFVLLALPIVLPIILGVAFFMVLCGVAPFYSQDRVGKSGRMFRMWTLRTSLKDAGSRCASPGDVEGGGDPCLGRFGLFLRHAEIDRFPQFYNILIGDMSVIGPQPKPAPQVISCLG